MAMLAMLRSSDVERIGPSPERLGTAVSQLQAVVGCTKSVEFEVELSTGH
jgi:hypothetical protein